MVNLPPRRRVLTATFLRLALLAVVLGITFMAAKATLAQSGTSSTPPAGAAPAAASTPPPTGAGGSNRVSIGDLFMGSVDLFTVLLVIGSLAGWTVIIICFLEVREKVITPADPPQIISGLIKSQRWGDLRQFVTEDDAFVSRVVRAAALHGSDDKGSMREAAELTASEECSRWFRRIEPLNVIGNLGPLLGLAGTVYGMILAFAALGEAGGQANPANLSLGISKALFHTLLGLLLAVPCLTVFGFYRSRIDRLCTRAMVVSSELVEMLPASARTRLGDQPQASRPPIPPTAGPAMPTPRPNVS